MKVLGGDGIIDLAYGRWEGLTMRTRGGVMVRILGSGDSPLRVEVSDDPLAQR